MSAAERLGDMGLRPMTGALRADGAPLSLEEYRRAGGYEALRRAVTGLTPREVIEIVQASDLRGRGGAGFSAGRKWSFTPDPVPGVPKYVVCNCDEMEPGSFKDRFLIERNPHLLVEGVALAAYATQSPTAYIFFRGEYHDPERIMARAIAEAYEAGLLGERVLGSEFSLELFTHMSAGRYICGEASAMLSALEGRRGVPRFRPPHMASAGLWARPTIVNNVETLCCMPGIVTHGAEWWQGLGRGEEGGTKIFTVAGRVRHPGAWELPMGTPMREVIEEHAGGMRDGLEVKAVIPGGASSPLVPARHLDVRMDFGSMIAIGSRLGTATMVVLDDKTDLLAALVNLEEFFAQESCGWCVPCWSGLQWVVALLKDLRDGRGTLEDIEQLDHLVWALGPERTFCDHAPGAMQPLESALREFRGEFEERARSGRPPQRGSAMPDAADQADEAMAGAQVGGADADVPGSGEEAS
jgi:NADH-quinone oxidoreductase subunit F